MVFLSFGKLNINLYYFAPLSSAYISIALLFFTCRVGSADSSNANDQQLLRRVNNYQYKEQRMHNTWRVALLVLALTLLFAGSPAVQAQSDTQTLVGTVKLVVHGDMTPQSSPRPGLPEHFQVLQLTATDGQIYQFTLTPEQTRQVRQVPIGSTISVAVPQGTQPGKIMPVNSLVAETKRVVTPQALANGPWPYVNVLCGFENPPVGEPEMLPVEFFREVLLGDFPQSIVNSFKAMDIDMRGSASMNRVAIVPGSRDDYSIPDELYGAVPNFDTLLPACVQAAGVDLNQFAGVNIITTHGLGCCMWGGRMTLGGKEIGYTVGAGNYDWWLSFVIHEMGHSLKIAADFGWYHADNPLDVMSRPAEYCPDDTPWEVTRGCTAQGTSLPQLLRAKPNSWPHKQVGLLESGTVEVTVGYLYEPLANGHTRGVVVQLTPTTSVACEARRGLQQNVDYKMWNIDGVACYSVNEMFHAGTEFQDVIARWFGDGSDTTHFVGNTNTPPLLLGGVTIDVRSRTTGGFRLRLDVPARAILAHDIDTNVVSVEARNFPANLSFPATLPVTLTVRTDTINTNAIVQTIYLALDRETGNDTPTWRGILKPCIVGQWEYSLKAELFGIKADSDRTTELNRQCGNLQAAQLSSGRELQVTPADFPPGTTYANVVAPYDVDGNPSGNITFAYVSSASAWRGTLPCVNGTHTIRVRFQFQDVVLSPNEFRVTCHQTSIFIPVVRR